MKMENNEHLFAIKLMQDLVVPTFVLDATGKVIIWNVACENLTGVKAEALIGTSDHWRAFYDKPRACLADVLISGDWEEQLNGLYATYSEPGKIHKGLRAENWCVMPEASVRLYLAINAGPIYDDHGDLIAVVETLRDMTEQKRAEDELKKLAHQDGLTKLANRRAFDVALDINLQFAVQGQTTIGLILGDIDHFKAYNDFYGHQSGDECLTAVAKALDSEVGRPTDVAARYGGEEFAVILPGIDTPGAVKVAERIRQSVFDLNVPHDGSTTADFVTMSLGLVNLTPTDGLDMKRLIEMADQALYLAKASGRNQVSVYELEG